MSSERALAIEARGIGKSYQVYARPQDRLFQMLWRGRRKFYREFRALRSVDLDVAPGETVGIVGRNGSGKSTLLQIVCGTLQATEGSLEVRGHLAPLLTLGTGFNPEFTGRENVLLNAAILGLADDETGERLDSIVRFADIGEFFDQPVRSYSSGMVARLAFAVAIHADPDILVIDELLAVGDEAFTRKCFARIRSLKAAGSSILFASHSAASVIELCDRAILLEAGERLLSSDPKTVIGRYQRLIHAPDSERAEIADEIRALDRAGGVPSTSGGRTGVAIEPEDRVLGRLDPNLRPESTVEYLRRGATIERVRILDARGAAVNVLMPGGDYVYAYDVHFSEPACGVRFGMMLKLPTGFELAGQTSHAAGRGIGWVERGSTARVRFPFRASLAHGAYFMNAGVLGERDGEETYLHRILDAVMFRVEPVPEGRMTGRVDLFDAAPMEVELASPGAGGEDEETRRER